MNIALLSKRTALRIVFLFVGAIIILIIPLPIPPRIGSIDFRPYWSSSFLLAHGQDFSDPSKLDDVERKLTGWSESYTMSAWFAPTGNLVLLPYTVFSFQRAAYYWLITNIMIVFFGVVLIWHHTTSPMWIALVAAFGFSMTLLSLIFGQVNTLVMLGIALFLFFSASKRNFAMGASLILTTIKPHLVILTLPLLIFDIIRRKQWRVIVGFIGTLAGCALILFYLYPAWPNSFWNLVISGMSSAREVPTLAGILVLTGNYALGKWIWLIGLVFAIIVCWKFGKQWDRRTLIDVSIFAGLMIAPIGWSYDQIMLLFPLLRILEWVVNGSLARKDAIAVVLTLVIMDGISFYERILTPNEVWFFWVPLVVAAVYVVAMRRKLIVFASKET
jgi:Glycosyltransferase family 87